MKFIRLTFIFTAGLALAIGGVAIGAGRGSFADVPADAFYKSAAERFGLLGVITGYNDGRFGPDNPVTRGQLAAILDRYDKQVVEPLRTQVEKLRAELSLGKCGDGEIQEGEECDDGNKADNDGCNSFCVLEEESSSVCPRGRVPGDRYRATDGCNWCECLETGEKCTTMSCTGVEGTVCGNGVCEEGEDEARFCQPCRQDRFGNVIGQCGCILNCPQDCRDDKLTCAEEKEKLEEMIADREKRTCETDADCSVFVQKCPPVTCGEAINGEHLQSFNNQARRMISACKEAGPLTCGNCPESYTAICTRGRCTLEKTESF